MTSTETDPNTKRIAELNDALRAEIDRMIFGQTRNKVFQTQGIANLPPADQYRILKTVRDFNVFTEDNDPYGEHDFGAFDHKGQKIFWKIDYYDTELKYGSEDPADPDRTTRVLTIMLASEY